VKPPDLVLAGALAFLTGLVFGFLLGLGYLLL